MDDLVALLQPEAGERVVISGLCVQTDGKQRLACGSLLLGPPAMARVSWPAWRRSVGHDFWAEPTTRAPSLFSIVGDGWTAFRTTATLERGRAWLGQLVRGEAAAVGNLPRLSARLSLPEAPLLVNGANDTPASRLVFGAGLPVRGFFLRTEAVDLSGVAEDWVLGGGLVRSAGLAALGVSGLSPEAGAEGAALGLLVGRVQRAAWLLGHRVTDGGELFVLDLGLDPRRVEVEELEVEVREYLGGELVLSRRTRLSELRIPASVRTRLSVALPTMGRGVEREIALFDGDGVLLDHTTRFFLIERVGVSMAGGPLVRIGDWSEPALADRLGAFASIAERHRQMLRAGLPARVVFGDARATFRWLRRRLARARREVLIMDPYFGGHPADWNLLAGLGVPIRVLSGSKAMAPPAGVLVTNLQGRRWRKAGNKGPNPPFHDRLYLWGSRGLSVGTSPSGFGTRAFRVDELGSVEADAWRQHFETWWSDPRFEPF